MPCPPNLGIGNWEVIGNIAIFYLNFLPNDIFMWSLVVMSNRGTDDL